MLYRYPIAIVGAGPIGLAAAAHLIRQGETPLLFEAGILSELRYSPGAMYACFLPGATS
jgi:2-polyprenyl-6-methoxyphenol hydroxylase-like FAD-dependent oxidoreductase